MRSPTFGVTSIFPPRCTRKVRSETLRTLTPSRTSSASVISSACRSDSALHEMSTMIESARDSTTSNAVMTPPTRPTATARSPAAVALGGASTRAVMA